MRSMIWRRLLLPTTIVVALATALGPQVSKATTHTQTPQQSGSTISVVYSASYLFDADPQAAAFWSSIKKQFEARYTGNHLTLIPEPGLDTDEMSKINLMLRLPETTPDVLSIPTDPVGALAQSGYLAPLNNYVAHWSKWQDFPAPVRVESTIDGKVYGVNTGNNTFGLLYDMPIFRKVGLPVPWHPHTWADVLAALRKIKAAHLPNVYGIYIRSGQANGNSTVLKGIANFIVGAKQPTIFDTKTKKWVVSSSGLLDSFTLFHTMLAEGLTGPASDLLLLKPTGQYAYNWLPHQKYATFLVGNWVPGLWLPNMGGTPWPQAKNVYSVTGIPTEYGQAPGITSAIGGWTYAITAASKHKDLDWDLITLLEEQKNTLVVANQSGVIPPARQDYTSKAFVNFVSPYNAPFNVYLEHGTALPFMPGLGQWEQAMNDVTGSMVQNPSMTGKQAEDKFAQEASQLLGSNSVETLP